MSTWHSEGEYKDKETLLNISKFWPSFI